MLESPFFLNSSSSPSILPSSSSSSTCCRDCLGSFSRRISTPDGLGFPDGLPLRVTTAFICSLGLASGCPGSVPKGLAAELANWAIWASTNLACASSESILAECRFRVSITSPCRFAESVMRVSSMASNLSLGGGADGVAGGLYPCGAPPAPALLP